MEDLGLILNGFSIALQPLNLLFLFFGAVLGTVIGLLPGIGPAVADRIIAKLHRKMTPFALMVGSESASGESETNRDLVAEALQALVGLGHSASDARLKLDAVLGAGSSFSTVEDVLREVYRQQREDV